jgi:hypothetical protein
MFGEGGEDGEEEEGGPRGPVAAVRVKLMMARSYLALGQHKGALPVLDQVGCVGCGCGGCKGGRGGRRERENGHWGELLVVGS